MQEGTIQTLPSYLCSFCSPSHHALPGRLRPTLSLFGLKSLPLYEAEHGGRECTGLFSNAALAATAGPGGKKKGDGGPTGLQRQRQEGVSGCIS